MAFSKGYIWRLYEAKRTLRAIKADKDVIQTNKQINKRQVLTPKILSTSFVAGRTVDTF